MNVVVEYRTDSGDRRSENATMDVRSYEVEQYKSWKNMGDKEGGENRKESPEKEVEVVLACDEERERNTAYEEENI